MWVFLNLFLYELWLVQLHFFSLAVISWVISLLLITSRMIHNSSTYRNCNWSSGVTGLTCWCLLYLAESKGHPGWDPAWKLFCPPLYDSWSVWNDWSKIQVLGWFFFLLYTCGGLEGLSSAEILCVEGRALINFIGSILRTEMQL